MYINEEKKHFLATKILYLATFLPVRVATRRPGKKFSLEHCRCDPSNYRPITVLPTLSKILEKAIHNQLYYFLNNNKIITSKQFGFRPKLSTNTALTHFTDNVLLNMDRLWSSYRSCFLGSLESVRHS